MTYDFDDPRKFEDEYDASAEKGKTAPKDLQRNVSKLSKMSIKSVKSYISNLSEKNQQKQNHGECLISRDKITSISRHWISKYNLYISIKLTIMLVSMSCLFYVFIQLNYWI